MILPERKGWALYRSVSDLFLSRKREWRRMKWKLYAEVQRPEKWVSSSEEGLSSLPEGEWAVVEFQRGIAQDEVKLVCRCAKGKDKHIVWCNLMYKKVFLILSHIMWTPFGMSRHETIFLFFLFTLNRFYKRKNICWWELWIFSEVDTQRCSFTGEHPYRNVFQ